MKSNGYFIVITALKLAVAVMGVVAFYVLFKAGASVTRQTFCVIAAIVAGISAMRGIKERRNGK